MREYVKTVNDKLKKANPFRKYANQRQTPKKREEKKRREKETEKTTDTKASRKNRGYWKKEDELLYGQRIGEHFYAIYFL